MTSPIDEYRARLRVAMDRMTELRDALAAERRARREPIAVLGMGGRFPPDRSDPDAFFDALLAGEDATSPPPTQRFPTPTEGLGRAGWLSDVRGFDAGFFGISPREAAAMDPQQRLLLESTFEALERAGQPSERLANTKVGVFVGLTATDYLGLALDQGPEGRDIYSLTGNGHSFAAGRLAFSFAFEGPCLTVDTACSSSLVAVHLAVRSLRDGDCTLAVAAGVHVILSPTSGALLARSGALAPDGRCKTFDASADGFTRGEGCGVVVLKRLADAQRDGDPILAVIRGSATNQDGRSTGFTAPSVLAQEAMLRQALADAGLTPEDIGYIETHGTGTALGDPIELAALTAVFGGNADRCMLGALKSNLGHLEAAAGIVGLIKAVQCLRRGVVPGNLHFKTLNPHAADAPFIFPTTPQPWPAGKPRRAGISAFGMSGSNAHIVLEQAPTAATHGELGPADVTTPHLLTLSARSPAALAALATSVAAHLETTHDTLADLCFTTNLRRSHHPHRLALVATDRLQLAEHLRAFTSGTPPGELVLGHATTRPRPVFVFPGQGAAWPGMADDLLADPAARAVLLACDEHFTPFLRTSILAAMQAPAERSRLTDTELAQPALFAVSIALTALLRARGIEPAAVLGHSVGEIAAAHVAGVLDLADAARLVCIRGLVMQQATSRGAMAAVDLSPETAARVLTGRTDRLAIAAINGPDSIVLAGEVTALDAALAELQSLGARTRRLRVDYAFHSPGMASLQPVFLAQLGPLGPRRATLRMFSTVTGAAVDGPELGPDHWSRGIRQPVLFAAAVGHALAAEHHVFVEVGPHPTLTADLRACAHATPDVTVIPTLWRARPAASTLLRALAELHVAGQTIDFTTLHPTGGQVVALPTYPWQHRDHWLAPRDPTCPQDQTPQTPPDPPPDPLHSPLRRSAPEARRAALLRPVRAEVGSVLGVPESDPLPPRQGLFDLGLDSMMAVELRQRLERRFGVTLTPTLVFEHPTIDGLAAHIADLLAGIVAPVTNTPTTTHDEPIAIIGMSCRFPGGANDPEAFWTLLRDGTDAITEVPPDRWDADEFHDPDPNARGKIYARRSGFLQNVDVSHFDAAFFHIAPAEARGLDPQQRLLLDLTWEALEDAGQSPDPLVGSRTGVYIGIATADYAQLAMQGGVAAMDPYVTTGTAPNTAAGRLSHFLGLRGPAIALDTACSSSLVAAHLACDSLRRGESDLAIVGGVNLMLAPFIHVMYARMGTLAPDSRCKAFDASADGMVRGEGGAIVVLKRLSLAQRDGDRIHAVLRGSALNHDGRSGGLTVPSGSAQREVLRAALHAAGVEPASITYVETHGTGTALGDPIEANALISELGRGRPPGRPLLLGAAKASIGHLEAAAGMAGLLKVILALQHREVPPQRNFTTLNPAIVPGPLTLVVPIDPTPWPDAPLIAGLSAFGMSGTNAHLILEAATPHAPPDPSTETSLVLPISARSPAALRTLAAAYRDRIQHADLADVCAAAALRRAHLEFRLALTGRDATELTTALDAFLAGDVHPGWAQHGPGERPRLVFVFAGHSGHWLGMGRSLYAEVPVFRAAFDSCAAALAGHRDGSLIADLHAADAEHWHTAAVLQPLVLAIQLSLAELWSDWGVLPQAVVGHSMGELAAACVAGALTLHDTFKICVHRSRLIDRLRGQGSMASVALSIDRVEQHLAAYSDRVSVAAANSPQLTVISGDPEAIREICDDLTRRNIFTRPMRDATTAGHSPQLDPLLPELATALAGLTPHTTRVPFHSTVTASELAGESLGPDYWLRNLREPVRFTQTIAALGEAGLDTFLEISPNPLLLGAIEQTLRPRGGALTRLASLKADAPELPALHTTLARLFTLGLDPAWSRVHPHGSRAVSLPRYPWQRQRHWLATPPPAPKRVPTSGLGAPVIAARAPHDHFWDLHHTEPVLQIQGLPVLPLARPLELAIAAHRHLSPGTDINFTTITLTPTPIDAPLDLQLIFDDPTGPHHGFELHLRRTSSQIIASGTTAPAPADPPPEDLATIQRRCTLPDPDRRTTLEARGLELPASLWAIDHSTTAPTVPREALARLTPGTGLTAAILESSLHLLASLALEPGAAPVDGELFLPSTIEHLWLGQSPAPIVWAHATLRTPASPSFGATGDLRLLDLAGHPVATLRGVQLRPLGASLARRAVSQRLDRWFYDLRWQPAPAPLARHEPGTWLLLADAGGLARAVAERLISRGDRCLVIPRDHDLATTVHHTRDTGSLRGVLHLRGLDTAPPDTLPDTVTTDALDLLHLVQALAHTNTTLLLATRGAQPVRPGPLAVAAGPLWGMARTIHLEHPNLDVKLLDLDPTHPGSLEVDHLLAELDDLGPEDLVAYRDNTRHVARLVRATPPEIPPPLTLRPDATYLITGGLGGVGLQLARWIVDRGARHLVLVGRSGLSRRPDDPRREAIDRLTASGALVKIIAADVADLSAMTRVLADIPHTAPLRGIFHLAGTSAPMPLLETRDYDLRALLRPKVGGSWVLHTLSKSLELDYFVCFSSAATAWSAALLGPYSAANHFLDVLAHHRRALGLPALSVDWGGWSGGGMATADVQRYASDMGLIMSPAAHFLEALDLLIQSGAIQKTVAAVDWRIFKPVLEARGPRPLLEHITVAADPRADKHTGSFAATLTAAATDAQWPMLVEHVRARAAEILGFADPQALGRDQGFFQTGMDSVMSVRLRNDLERTLGASLPPTLAFEQPSVDALATWLAREVLGITPPDPPAPVDPLASLQDLSATELAALLEAELEGH